MSTLVLERSEALLPLPYEMPSEAPVSVDGDSIRLRPEVMEEGRYYCVTLHGKPYLYRKVSDGEIEVYGLVD